MKSDVDIGISLPTDFHIKGKQSLKKTAAKGAENAACVTGGIIGAAKLGAALGSPGGPLGIAVGFTGGVIGGFITSMGINLIKNKK